MDALTSKTAATSPQFLIGSALEYMGGLCLTANRSALRLEAEKLLETWLRLYLDGAGRRLAGSLSASVRAAA